jgi:hypothetical protein
MATAVPPQVLRYPLEAITEETDYLQVRLINKNFAGQTLIRSRGFANPYRPANPSNDLLVSSRQQFPAETRSFIQSVLGVILLPMPSNITDANSVNYSEDTLDAITAGVGQGALKIMNTDLPNDAGGGVTKFLEQLGKNSLDSFKGYLNTSGLKDIYLKKLAAEAAGIAGVGNVTLNQILARGEGQILNPNMELLFNGPTIRNFRFSFKLTPRDEKEAKQVKLIIGSLKRHMAPIDAGTFLGTPNFFELRYKQGRDNHKFLHKFKQCVLSDMSVNYTGENIYATYSDGTPVSMIMDLTFKELEPIYAQDYNELTPEDGVGF